MSYLGGSATLGESALISANPFSESQRPEFVPALAAGLSVLTVSLISQAVTDFFHPFVARMALIW